MLPAVHGRAPYPASAPFWRCGNAVQVILRQRSKRSLAFAKKVCGICQKGLWQLPRKHRYPQMTLQKRPPHTADRRVPGRRKPLFAVCAARCCNIIIKRCGFFRVILLTLHETSNQPKKNTDYKWKALLHTRQARSGRNRRP